MLDQPTAARKPGGGGLITLILFTVAKDNRANARLKATKLKKLRDPPSSELPYQRNKETRHEYLQDSGPDLVSAPLPSVRPYVRPSFLPSLRVWVGQAGVGRAPEPGFHMEDLAFYNQGYKALCLLITRLASVVMNRLLREERRGEERRRLHGITRLHSIT